MARILIVDDDMMFCDPLSYYLGEIGHGCDVANSFEEGKRKNDENEYDIIFLDVVLPDLSGLSGISILKNAPSSPEIIIITGKGSSDGAEVALTNGAWDYIEKPPSYSKIQLLVKRASEYRMQKLNLNDRKLFNREEIIGNDPKLKECFEVISKASPTQGSVFISGETGTGKDLMARAVHINSPRAKERLVTVDCTNIPENLVETLLFGHVRGTFTGAVKDQEGLIRQAEGGTLFFDEVGDLPLSAQKSVLGVLQNRRFRPLGAKNEVDCDFRVVSSTNRDLKKMVEEGSFRRDLYYRLVSFSVHLPPLRERTGDVKTLATHYVSKICEELGIHTKGVSREFVDHLTAYDWPGNIRELVSTLHTAIVRSAEEPVLYHHLLPLDIRVHYFRNRLSGKGPDKKRQIVLEIDDADYPNLKAFRVSADAEYLDELIRLAEGKVEKACKIAGVSRSGLYNLLEKHGRKIR